MKLRSLKIRLLLLATLSIMAVLAVAGLAIANTFASHVQRSFERALEAQLDRVVALVDPGPAVPRLSQPMPDARYRLPGGGMYWQVIDPTTGVTSRSRSLWDLSLAPPATLPSDGTTVASRVSGPDGEAILLLSRKLQFDLVDDGSRTLLVLAAEDLSTVESANAAFRGDLLGALLIIGLALIATAWAQITLGLWPLAQIKRGISTIRSGDAKRLGSEYPSEVMPLVSEVNELLAAQEQSIDFARDRAADLAHGLKTSLTLLNGQAFELRQSGTHRAADTIERLTADMTATIDHQLRLSRLRRRTRSDTRSTALAETTAKVVAAIRATPRGQLREWSIDVPRGIAVAIETIEFVELLGVVLENASHWAKSRVQIVTRPVADKLEIVVSDDGPGLDEVAMGRLGERGRRLDERASGTGIGLAIAREVVELNGGELGFARSELGGLAVTIALRPARLAGAALPRR